MKPSPAAALRLLLSVLLPVLAWAQTGTSLDAKVQVPQLGAPQRGSLVGQLAATAFGPGDVSRGAFHLPSPFAAPGERGPLLVSPFPEYAPDAGISEWGSGWQTALAVTRSRLAGDLDYATDELTGPWGRMVRGSDGTWYPVGLSRRVRLEWTLDTMTAWLPDGSRWTFGGTARVANARGTYAWHLTEVVDPRGRKTRLSWAPNASGRQFLQSASWGGIGDDFQYRADLTYETLALPFADYRSGALLSLDRRVKRVAVLAKNAGSAVFEERWRHDLGYQEEGYGPAFYLATVQQVFRSGEAPPPTRYVHALARDRLATAALQPSGTTAFDPQRIAVQILTRFGHLSLQPDRSSPADVELDGLTDLENASDYTLAHLSAAGVAFEPLPAAGNASPLCRRAPSIYNPPRLLAQVRSGAGDEATYVVDLRTDATRAFTTVTVCDRLGQVVGSAAPAGDWVPSATVRLVDLNRDHLPDVIRVQAGLYRVLVNTSTASTVSFTLGKVAALTPAVTPDTAWVHDVNGDGIPDLVVRYAGNLMVYPGKGGFDFAPGQAMALRALSGVAFPRPGDYAFTFVDANRDGLADLVLSKAGASYLLMNRGGFFQDTTVPGLRSVDATKAGPYAWDVSGSGDTQVVYRGADPVTGAPLAWGVVLDGPETGLLASADDGRGTVLRFGYARARPAAGQRHRQPVLASLGVESSGQDPVSYAYDYLSPRLQSVGKFLLGFDQITRTDPLLTEQVTFLNEDRYAGLLLSSSRHDASAPGVDVFETRSYEEVAFQGIPWKRLKQERGGFRDGAGVTVAEQTDFQAYVDDFCPQSIAQSSASGLLTTTRAYSRPAGFGLALACIWNSAVEQGSHGDSSLDFRHETVLVRNAAGQVEKVESVNGVERWVLQTATYRPADGLLETVTSPGRGTSALAYDPATRLLARLTLPDGVVVEATGRDPLHDGILTLQTTRGTASYRQYFRFDGQERLRSQWDDLGSSSELNPVGRYAYQPATANEPAAIYTTQLVDAAQASARDTVDLLDAAGQPVASAVRTPQGWAFGLLQSRSRATGTTRRWLRPSAPATVDPTALDHAALFSGASQVGSEVTSPLHGLAVDTRTTFHAGVERRVTRAFALSGGLLQLTATENGLHATQTGLDAGRRLLTLDDEAGAHYAFGRDALGRLRVVSLPDGRKHRVRYDAHARPWRVEREGVASVETAFDAATGLPTTKKYFTHAQYQPANALVRTVTYAHDAVGRPRTETHALAAGGPVKVFTYHYDGATPAAPAARTTLGLLTGVSGDGYAKTMEYRADGRLTRRVLSLGTWRSVETTFGWLESGVVGSRTVKLYDGLGLLLSTSTQSYGYDPSGRLGTVKQNGATLATLSYGANDELSGATFANGNTVTLTYDPLTRRSTGSQLAAASGASTTLRLGARGLVDVETFAAGATSLSRTYGYSPQRFLTSAADAQNAYGYGFDGFGLPTRITRNGVSRLIAEAGDTLTAGSATYTFDGLRRTVSRSDSAAPAQSLTLAYGADGQLATATRGGVTYALVHDEAGHRLLKKVGTTPVAAYLEEGFLDGTGLTERFQLAGRTVGLLKNGVFTALATDLRGTVMAEGSGAARVASPFGQRDVHPAMAAAIDYVEKGFDADLGLVRMGVRDYDPEINRFTTADPLFLERPEACAQSPIECNLHGYGGADPLTHVDPSGKAIETPWDVANVALGVYSLQDNVRSGNWGWAAVDLLGLGYDVVATAVPFLPAGAGAGLKAVRAGAKAGHALEVGMDVARAADKANDIARAADRTANAAREGTKIHHAVGDALTKADALSDSARNFFKGANKASGPMPDLSWSNAPGVWLDLTTPGSWAAHVRRYASKGEGIPLLYERGVGVVNATKLPVGAGATATGVQQFSDWLVPPAPVEPPPVSR